jgi:hypothetical protein
VGNLKISGESNWNGSANHPKAVGSSGRELPY